MSYPEDTPGSKIAATIFPVGSASHRQLTAEINKTVQAAYEDAASVIDGQAETWPTKSSERSELRRVAIAVRTRAKEVAP